VTDRGHSGSLEGVVPKLKGRGESRSGGLAAIILCSFLWITPPLGIAGGFDYPERHSFASESWENNAPYSAPRFPAGQRGAWSSSGRPYGEPAAPRAQGGWQPPYPATSDPAAQAPGSWYPSPSRTAPTGVGPGDSARAVDPYGFGGPANGPNAFRGDGRWTAPPYGYSAFRPLGAEEMEEFHSSDRTRMGYDAYRSPAARIDSSSPYGFDTDTRYGRDIPEQAKLPRRVGPTQFVSDQYGYGQTPPAPFLFRPMDFEDQGWRGDGNFPSSSSSGFRESQRGPGHYPREPVSGSSYSRW